MCVYMCVSFAYRYEAQQGACVIEQEKRRQQGKREEMATKSSVDIKGTRCDSNPNSTDQSAPRVKHARNMAVCLLVACPCFTKVQQAQKSSVTTFISFPLSQLVSSFLSRQAFPAAH